MFDIDSRSILAEIEPEVYMFDSVLAGMAIWCPLVHSDKVIKALYDAMKIRMEELYPQPDTDEEIVKYLVCGFSAQK